MPSSENIHDFRQELDAVLRLKDDGGFHYTYQAQQLAQKAQQARQWSVLLKTPLNRWQQTLKDTRFVLDELQANGINLEN
ncbi:MAG: hypothetical protein AAF152_19040 [Cyanobacteria bacterium P01_A01_bin.114]